ncbi:MAG: hypothetical protein ACXWXS_04955 [Actinomycetota bacterium]
MRGNPEAVQHEENPRIRLDLRVFMLIEIGILAPTGTAMFFAIERTQSVWPWELTPFNSRFIGGFYLAAAIAAAIVLVHGRWAPARVLTTLAFVFTGLVLIVSIVHADRFLSDRPLTWVWFTLYGLLPLYTGYALWTHRGLRAAGGMAPRWLLAAMVVPAALMGAYGLGLLVAPVTLTGFWPWPVDAFHGRLYAAVPLTPAIAALMLLRHAPAADLFGTGVTLFAASVWIVLGVVVTDASTDSVDWASAKPWIWVGAFAYVALLGAAMVAASRRRGRPGPAGPA